MKDLDRPNKPSPPSPKDGEGEKKHKDDKGNYQFNLGMYRIENINNMLTVAAKRYHKAFLKKDKRSIEQYQAIVNTLYTEIYIYIETETDIEHMGVQQNKNEILTNILDKTPEDSDADNLEEHLRQVREVYLHTRQLLKEVGIDIPREQKIGKTDIFKK